MIFISLGVFILSLWQIGAIFVVCYQLDDENEEPGLLVKNVQHYTVRIIIFIYRRY